MPAKTPQPARAPAILWTDLRTDLVLIAFLVGFDAVARLLPHAPGFMPIAASALFAGRTLRIPALAVVVPILAMALSGLALGGDDWRIALIVYAAISLPAFAGLLLRRWRAAGAAFAVMLPCSFAFFVLSNFAVFAFSGIYSHDWRGLSECYVAALPFLQSGVAGDMFWTAVLFGGAFAVQNLPALRRRAN
jgi:hypothetical protein